MLIFLSIIGALFILLNIGFLFSDEFKEFRQSLKSKPDNRYVNNTTVNFKKQYYDSIKRVRIDGFYLSRGENYVYVYCYLPNGYVVWYSQFTIIGNSIAERIFFLRGVSDSLHKENWLDTEIVGNEIISKVNKWGSTKFISARIKTNGQLQVFKTSIDENRKKTIEWSDYDFVKFDQINF